MSRDRWISREEKYGASLTSKEALARLAREHSEMTFVERRKFSEPFESSAGSKRGKVALVFAVAGGRELLFTAAEGKELSELGVEVPRAEKPVKEKTGLGGLVRDV